jgi:LysR family carnitine catabolism transcriptional activator
MLPVQQRPDDSQPGRIGQEFERLRSPGHLFPGRIRYLRIHADTVLVETGKCELGLTDALDVPDTLEATGLGPQVLVFILPPGTTTSGAEAAKLTNFEGTSFVAAPEGTSTRRLLDERLGAVGLQPKLAVVSAQRDAILPLVLAGAGAALVPESMAHIAEQLGAVVARPDPPAVRQLVLVHRPGALSPAATRFSELALASPSSAS